MKGRFFAMAHNLFWKYGDGEWNSSKGIGRTVLAIVTDHIKRNPHKDFDTLSSEFLSISDADTQRLIDYLEEVEKRRHREYFYCQKEEIILLNDKEVVVNKDFAMEHESTKVRWEKFKELIREFGGGYVITGEDMGFADEVKSEHVSKAFYYIEDEGTKGKYGILYLLKPSFFIGVSHKECNNWFAIKDTMRVAYLYATGEQPAGKYGKFTDEQIKILNGETRTPWTSQMAEKRFEELGFEVKRFNKGEEVALKDENKVIEMLKVLKQFGQIILSGPPGTGKTFGAKEILKELFDIVEEEASLSAFYSGMDEELESLRRHSKRWDIVQFHPSYNYEDFVRGVQVETEGGNVVYKTQNKIFGDMCNRACKDSTNNYALIIDEINRANVSAVLGELIYALEYRDKEIQTPYLGTLIIPKNLYIIGTMNTADRTIGQIDYAVRRRFAFVQCLPDESLIEDKTALDYFSRVEEIFNNDSCISPDFDKSDVLIGHSYFMAKGKELTLKILYQIVYQVIPILEEYVKDGVLTEVATSAIDKIAEEAKEDIDKIEDATKKLLVNVPKDPDPLPPDSLPSGKECFYWENKDGTRHGIATISRIVLGVTRDYLYNVNPELLKDINDLQEWFPDVRKKGIHYGIKLLSEVDSNGSRHKFCVQPGEPLKLNNGDEVVVTSQYNNAGTPENWHEFKGKMTGYGYSIRRCYIFNVGEGSWREWKYCRKYGFIASGGAQRYYTAMDILEKGDIVFVYLAENAPKKGVICYGEVITNEAKLVSEFETSDGDLLADCILEDGKKYRERFADAITGNNGTNNHPDKVIGIKWLCPDLDNPLPMSPAPQGGSGGYIKSFSKDNIRKLQKVFNLGGKGSE